MATCTAGAGGGGGSREPMAVMVVDGCIRVEADDAVLGSEEGYFSRSLDEKRDCDDIVRQKVVGGIAGHRRLKVPLLESEPEP